MAYVRESPPSPGFKCPMVMFNWRCTSLTLSMKVIYQFHRYSLVPRPVCAIRVTRGGLEPSAIARGLAKKTPRQKVYACARLSISGLFFSHTFQSKSPARFILCAACGSVVLLYVARVFDYFVVIEIAFMDNQAQITETISRLDSEKVR